MLNFKENVSLKQYSSFKIGGNARYFVDIKSASENELIDAICEWRQRDEKKNIFILGMGTNILFLDTGFDGLVIKMSNIGIERFGYIIRVGAGTPVGMVNNFCIDNNLSGLEWAGGLPGTIGGGVFGNAGCFGGEMKDIVDSVETLNLDTGKVVTRTNKDCNFGYRDSVFKSIRNVEIITSVTLKLKEGEGVDVIKNSVLEKIQFRKDRHPMDFPNIGSIFKNVPFDNFDDNVKDMVASVVKSEPFPVVPAAYLIDQCNLKGFCINGACVSEKHANFIVNKQDASSKDVLDLIKVIKEKVFDKFGVKLEEEIRIIG